LPMKSFQPLVIQNTDGYSLSERNGNPALTSQGLCP
jgi:hypothetical protein